MPQFTCSVHQISREKYLKKKYREIPASATYSRVSLTEMSRDRRGLISVVALEYCIHEGEEISLIAAKFIEACHSDGGSHQIESARQSVKSLDARHIVDYNREARLKWSAN